MADQYATKDTSLGFIIRSEAIAHLLEHYDCIVLSRTPGLALLEEQRMRLLELMDTEWLPYPSSADFVVYPQLVRAGNNLEMRVNHQRLGGADNGTIKTTTHQFNNKAEFTSKGAEVLAGVIAQELGLPKKLPALQPATISAQGVWASLPWQDLSSEAPEFSQRSLRLMDVGHATLNQIISSTEPPARDVTTNAAETFVNGSTELLAATIGNRLSAEYLLYGIVYDRGGETLAQVFAVRCIDAAILGCRSVAVQQSEDIDSALQTAIVELIHRLPQIPDLTEPSDDLRIREASIFMTAGNAVRNHVDLRMNMYVAAYFLAQDTSLEINVLERFQYCISGRWQQTEQLARPDWRDVKLNLKAKANNAYVLQVMQKLMGDEPRAGHSIAYAKTLVSARQWADAAEIMQTLLEQGLFNPFESDVKFAGDYLDALSLSEQPEKAESFYELIQPHLEGVFLAQSVHYAAARHFQRYGNEDAEFAAFVAKAEGKWTFNEGADRFCDLLRYKTTPEERIRLLGLLHQRILNYNPYVAFTLCESHFQLGNYAIASELAGALIKREDLSKIGFDDEAEARAYLTNITNLVESGDYWPTAAELQKIPAQFVMYLQPVGELNPSIIAKAAQQAGEFFGCEFVVRQPIQLPDDPELYRTYNYNSIPLMRYLSSAVSLPEDAIYQVYVVDRRFVVPGRGPIGDTYRKGLGAMVSIELANLFAKNEAETTQNLTNMLIRQFRYFVEHSHGISSEQAPQNPPCVNAQAVSRNHIIRGYCLGCSDIYRHTDFSKVYTSIQTPGSE
ncbi:MAG: hypothetical protein EA353_11390 [Puniceicoccaceae bacterium]|nr:MAG: hypothetical protein EA353_11390 [Puniceicoccaceae bacterium]